MMVPNDKKKKANDYFIYLYTINHQQTDDLYICFHIWLRNTHIILEHRAAELITY